MDDRHSYAEFVIGTFGAQLEDCALQYPTLTKEFRRDFQRLSSAVKCHGLRFALETMPAYRKHFDQCLDMRRLIPSHLPQFGVDKKGGAIPRLLRGLVLRVFDRNGDLRIDADEQAIRWIRQILGVVRKLRMSANIKDTGNSVIEFYQIESEMRPATLDWDSEDAFDESEEQRKVNFLDLGYSQDSPQSQLPGFDADPSLPYGLLERIQQVADYVTNKLGYFNPMEWNPRHGPGAVSDQRFGAYKYDFKNWPERLERSFPLADFAVANYANVDYREITGDSTRVLLHEYPAKLCAVPKTISKPRLIACESTSSQWCQQSLRRFFYDRVHSSLLHSFLDFRRQDRNGEAALQASKDQRHATIDLSSASDRISCWHVERLFRRSPSLLRALQSTRAVWIKQEICRISPKYHYLRKFSTMGNATTFPVQSLFFFSLALGALLYARNLRVSDRVIRELGSGQILIYGDDIIVPADCVDVLLELLHALGLKVNKSKTFTKGNFRESCGVDAYNGHNVTTVNILDVPKRASPGSIVSSVDVHHNLLERGMVCTAAFIQKTARNAGFRAIRFVKHGSGLFGWSDLCGTDAAYKIRWNKWLHRSEVLCLSPKGKDQRASAKGAPGLLQYFTEAPREVTSAVSTLGYLTRRSRVGLTLGWEPLCETSR